MIVVKIELHSAVTKNITIIGQMIISNVGGSNKRGNYEVRVARKNDVGNLKENYKKPLRFGEVKDYPRLSYNVWRLVIRALLSTFPEENK